MPRRHAFFRRPTEAIERGATPEQVSAFLGNKSPQTTKKFYATLAVAPKIPTLA